MLGCEIFHGNILNSSTPVCSIFNDCSLMELFVVKFILNTENERAQDYSRPEATFAFCLHEEKSPLCKTGYPMLYKVAGGQPETHVNS